MPPVRSRHYTNYPSALPAPHNYTSLIIPLKHPRQHRRPLNPIPIKLRQRQTQRLHHRTSNLAIANEDAVVGRLEVRVVSDEWDVEILRQVSAVVFEARRAGPEVADFGADDEVGDARVEPEGAETLRKVCQCGG